jgi:hypothetical protein
MSCRSVLSIGAVVVVLSSIGCAERREALSSPNAPSADQGGNASDGGTRPPQPPGPEPPPATGTCVAEQAQWTVGQVGSASLLERARVDATASIARFIRPNEAVTMEFTAGRLNLYLDARGVVHAAVCG